MVQQVEFSLTPKRKGFHLVTQEIMKNLPTLPEQGILNLFVKHTSCALSINENYDPSVRSDMEQIYNRLVKTNEPYYSQQTKVRTTCRATPNQALQVFQ